MEAEIERSLHLILSLVANGAGSRSQTLELTNICKKYGLNFEPVMFFSAGLISYRFYVKMARAELANAREKLDYHIESMEKRLEKNTTTRKTHLNEVREAIPSDEPVYCYCRQVYYGDMVACDAPDCPIEWFHIECVGLRSLPRGQWYCPECNEKISKSAKKKKR